MLRRSASRVSLSAGLLAFVSVLFGVGHTATSQPPKALLVVGSTRLGPGDQAAKALLEKLGYSVVIQPARSASARLAEDKAVVLLSASAPVNALRGFADVAIPVLTWNPALFPHLGMTGRDRDVDFGEVSAQSTLSISNVAHPMAAGLVGRVAVSRPGSTFGWGLPGSNALWIATLRDANKAAIFAYEQGVPMVGRKAPARRVGFFASGETPASLTPQGAALLESALRWITAKNAAPAVSAGPDREVDGPGEIELDASVSDDGIPEGGGLAVGWTLVSGPVGVSFADASRPQTSVRLAAAGTYVLRLWASDGLLSAADDVTVTVAEHGKPSAAATAPGGVNVPAGTGALLVAGTTLTTGDTAIKTRLQNLGFTVTVRTVASYTASDLTGKKVVVLTANAASTSDVVTKFRDIAPGLVLLKASLFPTLAFTGSTSNTDYGNTSLSTVTIPAAMAGDPMAAGLTGTQTVVTAASALAWGVPAPSGVIVTTVPGNAARGTSFRYVGGTPMVGGVVAQGRRVGAFVADVAATKLTANGGALFDASVNWVGGFANAAPQVDAGVDHPAEVAPKKTALDGTVYDDQYPTPVTVQWSKVSGPGTVTFDDPSAVDTNAAFSAPGPYVLRLTATDSGALSASDTVTITAYAANQPPVVNAGADQSVTLPATITLNGSAVDEGLPYPPGTVTVGWSQVSGPGGVTFGTPTALSTTAAFSAPGTYVLRLTASDSALTSSDDLTVTVARGSALLVVGVATLDAGDTMLKSRLQALGFTVVTETAASTIAAHASGKELVVLSHSCPAVDLTNKFRGVTQPVITVPVGVYLDMGLATSGNVTAGPYTQLNIVNSTHPIAAGLTGQVTIATTPDAWFYGAPASGAVKIATVPADAAKVVVFSYEKGAQMSGLLAPARRVVLGYKGGLLGSLTDEGKAILDKAILWATGTNLVPIVDAGPDQVVTVGACGGISPNCANLSGSVSDDGMPNGTPLVVGWTKVSGPGTVSFRAPSAAVTTAYFTVAGGYVLRLSASDGQFTITDDVTIWVNVAPSVNAGPDLVITLPASATLDGTVTDTTLPVPPGALTISWSKVSGPGTVSFGSPNAEDTSASFSSEGSYLLRLTATDGYATTSDDVTVTVKVETGLSALLVTAATSTPGDTALQGRLQALGYTVVTKTDAAAAASDAAGRALVVITGSVDPAAVALKFRDVSVPVLVAQPQLFDDMGFTGPTSGIDYGTSASQTKVRIGDPTHPLAGGLVGSVAVTSAPSTFGWGEPNANAALAVQTFGLGHPTVFGYDGGSSMVGGIAPARRVGLFIGSDAAPVLTTEGGVLFEAAVHWTRGRLFAPTFNPTAPRTFTSLPQSVAVSTLTDGAQICYTLDGSEPLPTGTCQGPMPSNTPVAVSINTTATLKAKAFKNGLDASSTSVGVYTISLGTVATPTISAVPGSGGAVTITLSCATAGAQVFYTLDGSAPNQQTSSLYSVPFQVSDVATLTARGFKTNWTPSALARATYLFDPDNDGLSNAQEAALGTDPNNPDTNADGIDDGAEVAMGLSPTNLDMDGDGVVNATERANGTDPFKADTDGDGVPDGIDCFPLDPSSSQCPPNGNDHTPPTIFLSEPPGAVLVSTTP